MKPSAVLLPLLLACDHSESFVIADQEITGPFATAVPLRLTYSPFGDGNPGVSSDGAWLTYQFQTDTAGDRDRCVAVLPTAGGQRQVELCAWALDEHSRSDGLANAALRADGLVAFTMHSGLIGNLTSTAAALYLAPADSVQGAHVVLPLLRQPSGATAVWHDLIDPIWLDEQTLLVLAARRHLANIHEGQAPPPRDRDRTAPLDTIPLGIEFATIALHPAGAAVTSIAQAPNAIAWDLDRSTSTLHYIVQRANPGDVELYHESVADTVYSVPLAGGVATMRYGVPVANSGRELERLHGVATGQGRVFISRSWRRPQDVGPNSIPIGTPLQSEIIELLPDGSSRLIAAAPTWRWGRVKLSPDGRTLYAEGISLHLFQPARLSPKFGDIYRIELPS